MDDQQRPRDRTDETPVSRVVERDVPAFTVLYDRYAQTVYSMAAHMLRNTDAAEEMVHLQQC